MIINVLIAANLHYVSKLNNGLVNNVPKKGKNKTSWNIPFAKLALIIFFTLPGSSLTFVISKCQSWFSSLTTFRPSRTTKSSLSARASWSLSATKTWSTRFFPRTVQALLQSDQMSQVKGLLIDTMEAAFCDHSKCLIIWLILLIFQRFPNKNIWLYYICHTNSLFG